MSADTSSFIQFTHVTKTFGPKTVYSDLNLHARKGETLTVIGGSGVGKSVMLKMLVGLMKPDSGTIVFDGKEVQTMDDAGLLEVRRRIGMVFQGAALFDSMSVFDNVAYGPREHLKMSDSELTERVATCLNDVGLPDTQDLLPSSLSGGMRKRVGLARALALRPEVLLYDEPTTGLDPINTARISGLIQRMQERYGMTSIVVTHDMQCALTISDRIVMVHEGRIHFGGTPEEVRNSRDPRVHAFVTGTLDKSLENV